MNNRFVSIPALWIERRRFKAAHALGHSIRALWYTKSGVYLDGLKATSKDDKATYFRFEILTHCLHEHGWLVSGGRWFAVVPHDQTQPIRLAFLGTPRSPIQRKSLPYRPSMLPQVLFELTPEGSDPDDPFGGAANWIPFQ